MGEKTYLLLLPASTGHQCRTPGLNHLSPTLTQSPLHTASLCFAPGLLHHRAKLRAAPTPHSSHRPKIHKITQEQAIIYTDSDTIAKASNKHALNS